MLHLHDIAKYWPEVKFKSPNLHNFTLVQGHASIQFHMMTNIKKNGYFLARSITLTGPLSWSVALGDIQCILPESWHIPSPLSTIDDLIRILALVMCGKLCHGCTHEDFQFGASIVDLAGNAIAKANIHEEENRKRAAYQSLKCKGFLEEGSLSSMCSPCQSLNSLLRVKLFRQQSAKKDDLKKRCQSGSHTNWRFLDLTQAQERAANEKRKRVNAEKREESSKRKLDELKKLKRMSGEWDNDLSSMFQHINEEASDNDTFSNAINDPEVANLVPRVF